MGPTQPLRYSQTTNYERGPHDLPVPPPCFYTSRRRSKTESTAAAQTCSSQRRYTCRKGERNQRGPRSEKRNPTDLLLSNASRTASIPNPNLHADSPRVASVQQLLISTALFQTRSPRSPSIAARRASPPSSARAGGIARASPCLRSSERVVSKSGVRAIQGRTKGPPLMQRWERAEQARKNGSRE